MAINPSIIIFFLVFAYVFGFICILSMSINTCLKINARKARGVKTTATIEKISYFLGEFRATVAFTKSDGMSATTRIKNWSQAIRLNQGDKIPIIYDPQNTANAIWAEHLQTNMGGPIIPVIVILLGFITTPIIILDKVTNYDVRVLIVGAYVLSLAAYPLFTRKEHHIQAHPMNATAKITSAINWGKRVFMTRIEFQTNDGKTINTDLYYTSWTFIASNLIGREVPITYNSQNPEEAMSPGNYTFTGHFLGMTLVFVIIMLRIRH